MDYAPLEGPVCLPFTKAIRNVLVRTAWVSLSSSGVGQARVHNIQRNDAHSPPPAPSNRGQVMMTNLTTGYKGLRSTAKTGNNGVASRGLAGMDLCRWLREHGIPRGKVDRLDKRLLFNIYTQKEEQEA